MDETRLRNFALAILKLASDFDLLPKHEAIVGESIGDQKYFAAIYTLHNLRYISNRSHNQLIRAAGDENISDIVLLGLIPAKRLPEMGKNVEIAELTLSTVLYLLVNDIIQFRGVGKKTIEELSDAVKEYDKEFHS